MQLNRTNKLVIVLAIIGVVGLAASAYADWGRGMGRGFGPGACGGPGGGYYGMRGFSGPAAFDDLSDEEIDQLNDMRAQFFNGTKDLRNQMQQKHLELQSELAKQSPDESKALKLQNEISELRGNMAQKRLEQRLKLQKEFPDLADEGFGPGYGKGRGRGRGWDMGQDRGYGMMGPGYGRGGNCLY